MPPPEFYHAYNLPSELLEKLTPRHEFSRPADSPGPEAVPEAEENVTQTEGTAGIGSKSCNVCLGATFADVDDQRVHFRSDWHRYNVKLRLGGAQPVAEADFGALVDGLEDSISGTESSDDDESSDDAVDALISKTKPKHAKSDSPTRRAPVSALTWFHASPATQLGVYRALLPRDTPTAEELRAVRDMQRGGTHGRTWALFMTAGGHFAGAVVRVAWSDEERAEEEAARREAEVGEGAEGKKKKKKPRAPKPEVEVLMHKTFHRYTTRRKQGGSQGLNDNAKGNAKSAGAQLRRYGEQALRDDIRNLLSEWAEDIEACERIWIRATSSNRRIFIDEDGPLHKGDERLRTFPFPTRRPTQAELGRCLLELTRVKVSHLTEEALREQDEAYLASLPKPKAVPTAPTPTPAPAVPAAPKRTPEEEALRDRWVRALDMVHRGRLDALKGFAERDQVGGVNAVIPEWIAGEEGERGRTLLQVAAHAGQVDVTRWLLEDARADPTVEAAAVKEDADVEEASDAPAPRPGAARTAYDLAKTREVRNVFRRVAGEHPEWWDWLGKGHVQAVLTKEMEEEREGKKKARRKGLKDKVKEREAKEKAVAPAGEEVVMPQVVLKKVKVEDVDGPRRLGGQGGGESGLMGLTAEMRGKVERERRARAAEARMKALGG